MEFVYQKIKELRITKKLTQADVAKAIEMTTQGYQNIESGRNNISLNRLEQIANVLEVSHLELLGANSANSDCPELEKENQVLRKENEDLKQRLAKLHDEYRIFRDTFTSLHRWYGNVLERLKFAIQLLERFKKEEVNQVYQEYIEEKSLNPERWHKQTAWMYLLPMLEFGEHIKDDYQVYVNNSKITLNDTYEKSGERSNFSYPLHDAQENTQ